MTGPNAIPQYANRKPEENKKYADNWTRIFGKKPDCFGTMISAQIIAENDCESCEFMETCEENSKK